MSEEGYILLIGDPGELDPEVKEAIAARRNVRKCRNPTSLRRGDLDATDLVLITEAANKADRSMRPWVRDRSDVPILLIRANKNEIPQGIRLFDDAAFEEPIDEFRERVDLLLAFRNLGRRAASLEVSADEIRAELARYDLDPGLVGPSGLTPPGRVSLHHLVDIDAVNRQQMAICRLMGTSYGTFLHSWRPRGLSTEDGSESPPLGVLSPYCAYLSSQGDRCECSEYDAAMRALDGRKPIESACVGRLKLFTVPVSLTLGNITWPLFAASVAVGGVPTAETAAQVAEDFGVNPEILRQIGEESRFWFLNPDKVEEIRETFSNLAETISRGISHKYATAFQLNQRILHEREIQRSQRLLRESHQALSESNRRLKLKNEEIYEVTHAITHDLRKPLVSMKAVIGVLRTGNLGELTEPQKEAIDTAQEASLYMQQLVGDILEAAQLEAGRRQLEVAPIALPELVQRVRRRLRIQMEEQGIHLEVGALPETLVCDESAIEKVFMNLIGNSLSYIGDGTKRIDIYGEETGEEIRITVKDTGIGIPEKSLAEVFDKFQRGANVSGIRGTGLGLAIVRGVIEAHGGRVSIQSREGEGTTVTAIIPQRPSGAANPEPEWTNGVPAGGR